MFAPPQDQTSADSRQNGVSIMKKLLALLLVVCINAFIFVSCNGNSKPSETTGGEENTSGNDSVNTSASEVTTQPETTHVFVDQNFVDSLDYDYMVRLIKDDNNKTVGVAIYTWKGNKVSDSITFDSEYVLDGVTYPVLQIGVGQGVLSFQKQLKSVTIPGSVQKISKTAFNFCTALTTVNLSEGLEEIGEMAFWGCTSLETLTIPSTVTSIGSNAFADCTSLKSVTLPRALEDSINTIFAGCDNLTTINYID